jgi:Zn-dependent protease
MLLSLLFSDPLTFLLIAAALVISISIHEFAHAFVADRLGDPTPRLMGRLTLDPRAHLDPLGTIALFLIGFGWGKPVVFDPFNLKNPARDSALVALAGPATNILFAVGLSVILRLVNVSTDLGTILLTLITLNVTLAVFNLIPIHPLDGGKILIGLAPKNVAREWDELLSRYGLLILLFLLLPINNGHSAVSSLLSPIVGAILRFLVP